jgi:hypothetical protein
MPHSTRGNLSDLTKEAKRAFAGVEKPEQNNTSHYASGKPFLLPGNSFVEALATLIEWARYQKAVAIIERNIASIRCARQWPSAFIEFKGREGLIIEQEYRQPPSYPNRPHRIKLTSWQLFDLGPPARIMVDASISGIILPCLADLCGSVEGKFIELEKVQLPET